MAEKIMPTKLCNIPHEDFAIEEIEFGDRFRKDYGDLGRLKSTILEQGLIQPMAVMANADTSVHAVRLVTGGRRFKAIMELKAEGLFNGKITCRVFETMDELTFRSLELIENAQRKEMTFHEDVKLKEEIHRLEVMKHGPKISPLPDAPGHSQGDTAKLLNVSRTQINKDLKLYDEMKKLEGVIDFKDMSRSEATKAVKQVVKKIENKVGAAKAKKMMGDDADTRKLTLTNAYNIEDCTVGMRKIGTGTQAFVEIDPPYAIDLQGKKKSMNENYSGYNEIPVRDYVPLMRKVFDECWRIMKQDSWLVCWFGPEPWMEVIRYLIEGGTEKSAINLFDQITTRKQNHHAEPFVAQFGSARFRTHRMCGNWVKPAGQTQQPLTRLANSYENFFYVMKGNPELHKPGSLNTFVYPPVPPASKIHPTERPAALIKDLLEVFARPGDCVTVPFAGSGRTLLEAAKMDMIPTGFDLTQDFKDGYTIALTKELK